MFDIFRQSRYVTTRAYPAERGKHLDIQQLTVYIFNDYNEKTCYSKVK